MRVIGLISGTSVDGIDAVLTEISGSIADLQVRLLAGETYSYPNGLRQQILEVCGGAALSVAELAELDDAIAVEFAKAAIAIQQGQPPAHLIGSHGQTVFHRPPASEPLSLGYSLQLGRGAVIAQQTKLATVSNFRAADIAVGGQGAPMVPAVDAVLLRHPDRDRCVQNIGGIGNVAYLPARQRSTEAGIPDSRPSIIVGWDTGPGNVLVDLAVQQLTNGSQTYDHNGEWAARGCPCDALVQQWLQHEFFRQPPPKSTGRELFGVAFLQQCQADAAAYDLSCEDFLATLTDFTAASIAHSYQSFLPQLPDEVLLCGGGSKNHYLKRRLQEHLQTVAIATTDDMGFSSEFKEAIAFAVLAYWRLKGLPGNLPEVTGAKQAVPLGEIHQVSLSGAW